MSKDVGAKHEGTLIPHEEFELRRKVSAELESFLRGLGGGLTADTPKDLEALAELLLSVTEERKRLERDERLLKDELRRHFAEDSMVLMLGGLLVLREPRTRSDLDRKALTLALGADVVERYLRKTSYEIMTVKRVVR